MDVEIMKKSFLLSGLQFSSMACNEPSSSLLTVNAIHFAGLEDPLQDPTKPSAAGTFSFAGGGFTTGIDEPNLPANVGVTDTPAKASFGGICAPTEPAPFIKNSSVSGRRI